MAALPVSRTTLSYPLYACAFDPNDSTKLYVGGGGGAGRNGVGNKITLLSTVDQTLDTTVETELHPDEDNVTTLAVGARKGNAAIIFGGVNASADDVKAGKNEHLRTFRVTEPGATKTRKSATATGKIDEALRTKLFATTAKDAYQRVMRVSHPASSAAQVGIAATGLAGAKSEVVLCELKGDAKPKVLGRVELSSEAVDVDVMQTGPDEYLATYITDLDIWVQQVSLKGESKAPVCVYEMPGQHPTEKPSIPSFRSVRILSRDFLLLLTNIHSRGGTVLQVFRIEQIDHRSARLAASMRMTSDVKQSNGLAVVNLNPPKSFDVTPERAEWAVAVTSQDNAIRLFSVSLHVVQTVKNITTPRPLRTLKGVHPLQITGVAFAEVEVDETPDAPPAPTLQLASISVGNTVAVHTIPLARSGSLNTLGAKSSSSEPMTVVALALLALVLSIFVQAGLELHGSSPPYLHAREYVGFLPANVQHALGIAHLAEYVPLQVRPRPAAHPAAAVPGAASAALHAQIRALQDHIRTARPEASIVLRAGPADGAAVDAALFHPSDAVSAAAAGAPAPQTWDEMDAAQRARWQQHLVDAGHWSEEFAATVLRSVLFGELAGVARAAMN